MLCIFALLGPGALNLAKLYTPVFRKPLGSSGKGIPGLHCGSGKTMEISELEKRMKSYSAHFGIGILMVRLSCFCGIMFGNLASYSPLSTNFMVYQVRG